MGIPTFFKWLVNRYPLVLESAIVPASEKNDAFRLLKAADIDDGKFFTSRAPEGFDNLYLDVNGIVHHCSHSLQDLCAGQQSEDDIFVTIFSTITNILKLVKPKKLLYIAADGVAPRAKIMQQRERRFRSAADACKDSCIESVIFDESDENEDVLPLKSTPFKFDPIQITPGTPFMDRLDAALKFYCEYIICEHYGNLQVIYSGSDVPGEGEHKIAEYIRNSKARRHQEQIKAAKAHVGDIYNRTNAPVTCITPTSHCIYGLDADLIILSLVTHEAYISLLRENVIIEPGRSSAAPRLLIDMNNYVLLHIHVLREYLLFDLIKDKRLRHRPGVMDRLVDDFVLLSLLLGNDFLPRLKLARNASMGMPILLRLYSQYIYNAFQSNANADFWLTHKCGEINFVNFLGFLSSAAKYETDVILEAITKKISDFRDGPGTLTISHVDNVTLVDVENCKIATDRRELLHRYPGVPKTVEAYKNRFYFAKFGICQNIAKERAHSLNTVDDVAASFLEGIQWILYYYYRGVASWSWSLNAHYPPFLSDLVSFAKGAYSKYKAQNSNVHPQGPCSLSSVLGVKFDLGAPVSRLEQLMLVLPPQASKYLPTCLGPLMTSPDSRLYGYYPYEFDIDFDDAPVPWVATVLLPRVPHELLLSAMNQILVGDPTCTTRLLFKESNCLTKVEKDRNVAKDALIFKNSNSATTSHPVPSPVANFPDAKESFVKVYNFENPKLPPGTYFPNRLVELGWELPKPNVWFPSLLVMPLGIRHTKVPNVAVYLGRRFLSIHQDLSREALENIQRVAKCRFVVVGYPYKHIGILEAVHTPLYSFSRGQYFEPNQTKLKQMLSELRSKYRNQGIVIGVDAEADDDAVESADKAGRGNNNNNNNEEMQRQNTNFLLQAFQSLPNGPRPSSRDLLVAKRNGIDHVCENVLVSYKRVDSQLNPYGNFEYALLPLVTFIASCRSADKMDTLAKSLELVSVTQPPVVVVVDVGDGGDEGFDGIDGTITSFSGAPVPIPSFGGAKDGRNRQASAADEIKAKLLAAFPNVAHGRNVTPSAYARRFGTSATTPAANMALATGKLNRIAHLKQLLKERRLIHGKYSSKSSVPVVCICKGSLYGKCGRVHSMDGSLNVSATFTIDYIAGGAAKSLSQAAVEDFKRHLQIQQLIASRPVKWHTINEISASVGMSVDACNLLFESIVLKTFRHEIGMKLVGYDATAGKICCLPGYATCVAPCTDSNLTNGCDSLDVDYRFASTVVPLVLDYKENFPELFSYLEKLTTRDFDRDYVTIDLKQVYTDLDETQLSLKAAAISKYCSNQPFARLHMVHVPYQCIDEETCIAICNLHNGDEATTSTTTSSRSAMVTVAGIENFHVPAYNTTLPLNPEQYTLGQTVAYIHHSEDIPIGSRGTIVAIYPQAHKTMLEVVLQKPTPGATDLFGRCKRLQGIHVDSSHAMPIYENYKSIEAFIQTNTKHDKAAAHYISHV